MVNVDVMMNLDQLDTHHYDYEDSSNDSNSTQNIIQFNISNKNKMPSSSTETPKNTVLQPFDHQVCQQSIISIYKITNSFLLTRRSEVTLNYICLTKIHCVNHWFNVNFHSI